jgi:hypothetical protein
VADAPAAAAAAVGIRAAALRILPPVPHRISPVAARAVAFRISPRVPRRISPAVVRVADFRISVSDEVTAPGRAWHTSAGEPLAPAGPRFMVAGPAHA